MPWNTIYLKNKVPIQNELKIHNKFVNYSTNFIEFVSPVDKLDYSTWLLIASHCASFTRQNVGNGVHELPGGPMMASKVANGMAGITLSQSSSLPCGSISFYKQILQY